jgi:cell division protease FtsH
MEAVEQVLVGKEKKDRILSKEERKIVSYHEVGHALISAVQKNTEPVQKITIVPRTMGALGYVMQVPEDEKYLQTKDEIIDDIIVSLGGRAAEEVIFNTVTTGAENDIEKATSMARSMITMFGMSNKFGLMQLESIQNRYLDGNRILNCSDKTAADVDAEVQKLLSDCYERAKQIIREHLDAMDKIAQFLIEKETITGKEFMKIYREVENIPEPTEEEQEKAKAGRIYATRAESALVGENVPVKKPKKDEPDVKDAASEIGAAAGAAVAEAQNAIEAAASEAMGKAADPGAVVDSAEKAVGEAIEKAADIEEQVAETIVDDKPGFIEEKAPDNEKPSKGRDGLFSHVPQDFDKKD